MGNSYTGGNHYDNERAKRHINKLLYGGKESLNYQKIKDKRLLLDVNQPNLKRIININTTTDFANVIDSKKEKFTFSYNSNKPSFITISDGKINPLSSYNIIYSNMPTHKRCYYIHDTSTRAEPFLPNVVYSSEYIKQLCNYLYNGEVITEDLTLHNVGEYIYQSKLGTFTPPNSDTPVYDDAYYFYIRSNDKHMQEDLKKGQPYEKYNMAYLSMFIPSGATIIDVGANIGTVSIPLSRLHNSNVTVIACEMFNDTKKILDKNIHENKAYNVISLECAIGDKSRPEVYIDIEHKDVNQGANKIGQQNSTNNAPNTIHMINIDSIQFDNVRAIKVDVEGAEPLVFYGARDTIRKYKPVIMFEKNEVVLNPLVQKELKIADEVFNFDIVDFCRKIGYTHFYKLSQFDFLLVHPDSFKYINKEANNKDVFRVRAITNNENITRPSQYDSKKTATIFRAHEIRDYIKFAYIAPYKFKNVNAISLFESTTRR